MITGHLGLAAAVHAFRRDGSLLWLLGASMAPDFLDALFIVGGWCNPSGLYSHTVPATMLIAAVVGGAAFLATGGRGTGALAGLLVMSHLPLDYVTGYKLFWPGGDIIGFRLYERPAVDFAVESSMVLAGWWRLRALTSAPRWARAWPAVAALVALQATADLVGRSRGGVKPSSCGAVGLPPS